MVSTENELAPDDATVVVDDATVAPDDATVVVDDATVAPDDATVVVHDGADELTGVKRLEHEGDIAADYLEGLLDIADFDGDIDMDVERDRAAVSIVGTDLDDLVGDDGEVLDALQDLTRLAVIRETGERSRLMLDIGGYRAQKKDELAKLAGRAVEDVKSTGEAEALPAMSPFERKVVHDVVAAAGLTSESEGDEPARYVVIRPA